MVVNSCCRRQAGAWSGSEDAARGRAGITAAGEECRR